MSDLVMDFRRSGPELAEYVSFFYQVRQSEPRFSAVDRADFAQFRSIIKGHDGACGFVDGTIQAMPELYIQGPTTGRSRMSGMGAIDVLGAGLMPAGWAALVPMDASAGANRLFDAADLLGPAMTEARAALVAPHLPDLLDRAGLSLSQVERRCKRYFGSPPMQLARKFRALRTAIAMTHKDANLDDILAEGFYDQSHLIREMKHFTDITPVVFAQQPTVYNQQLAKRIALERGSAMNRGSLIT